MILNKTKVPEVAHMCSDNLKVACFVQRLMCYIWEKVDLSFIRKF